MTIYERFAALPRARKGSTAVTIVEEDVLRKLIYDATWKHPEVSDQFRPPTGSLTTITGGATGGAPMQIQVHVDPPPPPSADVIAESVRRSRRRLGQSRSW